jgi:23S rRNA (cytosine1962-C5)-methyltransferase
MLQRDDKRAGEWADYELIDSGEHMKLERFGKCLLARPETQAIWEKLKPDAWSKADASFSFGEGGKGSWAKKPGMPEAWQIGWHDARFIIKPTNFKHIGIFPEQTSQWMWIEQKTKALENPKVLNLFGYTGAASVVASQAGALVTHVDASKQSLAWAKENAQASGLPDDSIRWILDDALQFAKRDARREAKYNGIILDPPAFGRGSKGEVWHIEEHLPELMRALCDLLSDKPGSFLILNGYAAGYTPQSFKQLVESAFGDVAGEFGELQLPESGTTRLISSGIYARLVR